MKSVNQSSSASTPTSGLTSPASSTEPPRQPVQKMTFDGLLRFVAKEQGLAREVFACYEAGAFGYHLHRSRDLLFQPLSSLPAEGPASEGVRNFLAAVGAMVLKEVASGA